MYSQSELKDLVDKAIANLYYSSESEKLTEPVKYILSMGGKRLRPVLSLLCCNLFRDKIDDAIIPSTGLEVFHNFTLVHDDIMDQAPVRRSFPTVHTKWNVSQAILSGDVMAFIANECFLASPPDLLQEIFKTYNKAAIEVCIGQQQDMDFEKAALVSESEYLRMIELKTAVLIAASAKIGAILGKADKNDQELLYDFGRNMGLAFQIQDDFLDAYGDAKLFGKTSGGDIVANKKTYLYVKAIEKAEGANLKELRRLYSEQSTDSASKVAAVMDIFDSLGMPAITSEAISRYIEMASVCLEKCSADFEKKSELFSLLQFQAGRKN